LVSAYAYLGVGLIEGSILYSRDQEKRAARREARRQRRLKRKLLRRQAKAERAKLRALDGNP
jgi:hypothetical protein